MPALSFEDLDVFLDPDEFGTTAEITFAGAGDPVEVVVIFDEAFLDPDLGEYSQEASSPRMQGRSADLAPIARRDQVLIDGRSFYALTGAQHDGSGWATVDLALEHARF